MALTPIYGFRYVAPAISRDATANAAITQTGTGTSLVSPTFSTASSTTLIVVSVGSSAYITDTQATSVAWTNSTPAGASTFTRQVWNRSSYGNHESSIWTATTSQTLSSQGVTVTGLRSAASQSAGMSVNVLVGASTTMGVSATPLTDNSSAAISSTLNGVSSGSWIFLAVGGEDQVATPLVAISGTTKEATGTLGGASPVLGDTAVNTAGNSGNISVGYSTTALYWWLSILEIKKQ